MKEKITTAVIERRGVWNVIGSKAKDYKMLVKFRLSLTVVFSSIMAYLIAVTGTIDWKEILMLGVGGFLVTGAANALNQVIEKDFDKLMERTKERPLARGRMKVPEAVLIAGFMSLLGILVLVLLNPLSAFLGMMALILYAFIYTPMKRISPISVLIGAIPGAMPTVIGVVALEGQFTQLALILFGIQFLWQFPHFWSIGWLGYEDYKNAGYKLLPSANGEKDKNTGLQSFLYALFLVPIGIMPAVMGVSGIISAVVIGIASAVFAYFGWNLYKKCSRKAALQLMFFSLAYLPLTLIVLFVDKI